MSSARKQMWAEHKDDPSYPSSLPHHIPQQLLEVFFFQEKQKKKTPTSSNAASSFEQLIKYKAVMGQEIIKASEKN